MSERETVHVHLWPQNTDTSACSCMGLLAIIVICYTIMTVVDLLR